MLMFLSECRVFPPAPCLAGKKNLMTARVSMLLKSRASLTCFRARFLSGRLKDLSAPPVIIFLCTRVLISPYPDQDGKKIMFLSEWCHFPSAPCLARKKKLVDSSRLDAVEIARVPDMLPSLFPSWLG
jgi:hypothetical protein